MVHGEYGKTLEEVFGVLQLSEAEKKGNIDFFKRRLANELWLDVKKDMKNVPAWAEELQVMADTSDPRLMELKKRVEAEFSRSELTKRSRPLFKKILREYITPISLGLEPNAIARLEEIIKRF